MNSCSKLGRNLKNRFQRVEASWYNQFLDNRVIVGNGWGGGESEIDRWLGGEGALNIWGWQVRFYVDESGSDQDGQLTEQDLEELAGRKNPHPGQALALSIFQIIRRHVVDNNSSIRIRGAVTDSLIEKCDLNKSKRGIRIDSEVIKPHCADLGQLVFEPAQPMPERGAQQPFLSPRGFIA
jgi:polygalacturonase